MIAGLLDAVFRSERVRLIAGLARRTRDLDLAEDALGEAVLRASVRWPLDGLPDNPGAWLATVAQRIAIDRQRRERREVTLVDESASDLVDDDDDEEQDSAPDQVLGLVFACCRAELPPRARTALALRVVLGLSSREIARAFLEPEATTAQRLVRAKRQLRALGERFEAPPRAEWPPLIEAACEMIYLLFNEGYAATEGPSQLRTDLCEEALRLGRLLAAAVHTPRTNALVALMLLHTARTAARTDATGAIVTLSEQDRSRWNLDRIVEGVALLDRVIEDTPRVRGPDRALDLYTVQAAIAALHVRAPTAAETDWPQIAALYGVLLQLQPSPVVELNAAVALAYAGRLDEGLRWVRNLEERGVLKEHHGLALAHAELLAKKGVRAQAERYYRRARRLAANDAERAHIDRRLRELTR